MNNPSEDDTSNQDELRSPHLPGSRRQTQQASTQPWNLSPWNFSSDSAEQLILTLPSISSALGMDGGDLADQPHRFGSPSEFLLARPSTTTSQPRPSNASRYRQPTPPHNHFGNYTQRLPPRRDSLFDSPVQELERITNHSQESQGRRDSLFGLPLSDQEQEQEQQNSFFDLPQDYSSLPPYQREGLFDNVLPPIQDFDPFQYMPEARPISRHSTVIDLTDDSPPLEMAPSTRNVRRSSNTITTMSGKRSRPASSMSIMPDAKKARLENVEQVDLVDVNSDNAYKELQAKQKEEAAKTQLQEDADKPVKLTDFQCIICLDSPTDLTVTWCGHLFCSQCLHEALHVGSQKKSCPICRQSIILPLKPPNKGKDGRKPAKNGVFPLVMKLMTAKKKGKQATR